MSTSQKTIKNMRLESRDLLNGIAALRARGDDITPDEAAKLAADVKTVNGLIAQMTSSTTEDACKEADAAEEAMKTLFAPERPPQGGGGKQRLHEEGWGRQSLGESLINHDAYKSFNPGVQGSALGIEFPNFLSLAGAAAKTTFTTATSTLTGYDRPPGIVMVEQQRLTVADLLAQGQTTANTIRYVQEDTFTNAATNVSEGGTKPEATFDTSEADSAVRKIAVTSKVTDELYADFPAMQGYIDERLRFMVGAQEEAQLLNGDGNAPNLRGILQTSGIQTQAKGADSNLDAIHKAITKVRAVGFYEPDAVVIHPTDWQLLKLAKDSNLQYMGGGPFYSPYAGSGRYTNVGEVWGMRAVVTTAISAGTALVGAFKLGAMIFRRAGVTMQMTNSNEDDFKKNLIALRCEERLALAVWRPKAFATVTGIA